MTVRPRSDSRSRARKTAANYGRKLGLHTGLDCCWTSFHMQAGSVYLPNAVCMRHNDKLELLLEACHEGHDLGMASVCCK